MDQYMHLTMPGMYMHIVMSEIIKNKETVKDIKHKKLQERLNILRDIMEEETGDNPNVGTEEKRAKITAQQIVNRLTNCKDKKQDLLRQDIDKIAEEFQAKLENVGFFSGLKKRAQKYFKQAIPRLKLFLRQAGLSSEGVKLLVGPMLSMFVIHLVTAPNIKVLPISWFAYTLATAFSTPGKVLERMRQSRFGQYVAKGGKIAALFVQALAIVTLALFVVWVIFKTKLGDIKVPGTEKTLREHLVNFFIKIKVPELLAKFGRFGDKLSQLLCPSEESAT